MKKAKKENYRIVTESGKQLFNQNYTEAGANRIWEMYNGIYTDAVSYTHLFNNREGQITGIRESSHCLSFGGDENLYGCLQLGMLELEDNKEFLKCVRDWKWVDEEYPEENYNVWRIMARSL